MVIWLALTYLGYLAALGAALGAGAYVAATRFSVVQRLLAAAVDRTLRRVADTTGDAYSVIHTDTGVVVTNVHVAAGVLTATEFGGSQAAAAAVGRLELEFPSLSRPLTLRLRGVRLAVQQVRLPQPLPREHWAAADKQRAATDRAARLGAVEQLLWGLPAAGGGTGERRSRWDLLASGGVLGRVQAKAVQRLLAVAVQWVRVEVADVELKYIQHGEPGPRPAASYLQGADGACLRIRSLALQPMGNVTAAAALAPGAQPDAAPPPPAGAAEALASAGGTLGAPAGSVPLSPAPGGSSHALGDAAAGAGREAGQELEPSWRQLLLQIPQLLWAGVASNRPSSSRLSMSGVSLSLITFPSTWRGYGPAKAAAGAAAAPAAPPFTFTPGRFSGAPTAAAMPADSTSPGKRRRGARGGPQVERVPQHDVPGAAPGSSAGLGAAARAQDVQQQQPQQQHSGGGGSSSWQPDYWELLRGLPVEEHVLFQQWEASIALCLLPPGCAGMPPAGSGGAAARGVSRSSSGLSSTSWLGTPQHAYQRAAAAAPTPAASPSLQVQSRRHPSPSPPAGTAATSPTPRVTASRVADANGEHAVHAALPDSAGADEAEGQLSPVLHPANLDEGEHMHGDDDDEGLAANGPTAAPVGPPQLRPLTQRPELDRSSMWAEAPTPVSPAERQAFAAGAAAADRPNGTRAHSADEGGGVARRRAPLPRIAETSVDATAGDPEAGPGAAPVADEHAAPAPRAGGSSDGPSAAGDAGAGADAGAGSPPGMLLLDVVVLLKALVPEINAASLAIANRLVDRQMHHANFGAYWAVRPQVPVHQHAAEWWQHAGEAIAAECGRVMRQEVPLAGLEARRRRRREYQALYAASHASSPGFQEPGRRWWQRRRVRPAAADDLQRLRLLEGQLTTEEVAHFRYGVAAVHSARLAARPALRQFVADKLDCIAYNRDPLTPSLLEQLLHLDQPAATLAAAGGAAAGLASAGAANTAARAPGPDPAVAAAAGEAAGFGVRVSVQCPKLGVALSMRSPAAAPVPTLPSPARPPYVQLTVHSISAEVAPSGRLWVCVDRLVCGPSDTPLAPVPTHTKILSGPSSVCRSVCRAADFFQYAVHGTVADEALPPDGGSARAFLTASLTPRPGTGGLTVDSPAQAAAGWAPTHWRPGGTDVEVRVAAVALTYHAPPFAALLHFLDGWDACKGAPWGWSIPRAPPQAARAAGPGQAAAAPASASASASAGAARAGPPPLPACPEPVWEMVLQSFSTHGTPVLGTLSLPGPTLDMRCPGLAVQLPYEHSAPFPLRGGAGVARQAGADGDNGQAEEEAATLRYALSVTMQNLQVSVAGEEAAGCLQGGAARRTDVTAYVDVFSYMCSEARRAVATRLVPARVTFDATRRTATDEVQEVESLESLLREVEIASMAKVWAYPDDLAAIMQGIRTQELRHGARLSLATRLRGPSLNYRHGSVRSMDGALGAEACVPLSTTGSGGGGHMGSSRGGGASVAGGMPPEFVHDPSKYPMPHIPFLKCGSLRGHIVMPLSAMPGEPGGAELAVAVSAMGLQTWVSPLHIWHLLSVERAVRDVFEYVERTRPEVAEECAPGTAAPPQQQQHQQQQQASLARPRSPKLLLSVGVAQVSLLWLIGTWTPKGSGGGGGRPGVSYRRAWGISVKRDDDAYLWARWLAPVYSVVVANVKAALRLQSNGCMSAIASVDGIVVRDLQLPETARHAYVLRPLPARARRLNAWHAQLRRVFLGISPVSRARRHWVHAVQTIFLRQRTSAKERRLTGEASPLDAAVLGNAFPLSGPQARLRYRCAPASRFRPAAAEITAEVGQMLAYVRIKQQASMTAFATQLTQITDALAPGSTADCKEDGGPAAEAQQPASSAPTLPKLQSALKVTVTVVGIDVLFRVQSRDLMSIKLDQGRVTVDQRAVTRLSGPRDVRLHIGASVHDVVVRDLRARVEHSLVLVPHSGEECCSVQVAYTTYVDPRRVGPRLNLLVENPRILLLFRFVSDVLGAVSIISAAAQQTEETAGAAGAAATAAGAPAAGAATEGLQRAAAGTSETAAAVAAGAATVTAATAASSPAPRPSPPLEVLIEVHNMGVVLPTTALSSSTLGATVDHLLIALPGGVMPATVLEECELPQVVTMMQEAVRCTREFKLSGFHDREGAAGCPPPEPAGGSTAAAEAASAAGPAAGAAATAAAESADCTRAEDGSGHAPGLKQRLKSGVDAVAGAAAAHAAGAADKAVSAGGAAAATKARARRERERRRPPGVLFLNESDAKATPSGVLHIPADALDASQGGAARAAEALEAQAQRTSGAGLPFGAAADFSLRDVADTVGRGIKGLFDGEALAPEVALERASPSKPGGDGRGAARRDRAPSVPLVVEDSQKTNLNPLLLDAAEDYQPHEVRPLPDPSFVIAINSFTVTRGQLVRVPNYFYQKEKGSDYINPRQGSFLPPSLASFSWPIDVWDLVVSAPFIKPTHIALGMFRQPHADAPLLHFSASELAAVFNAPNFTALMDFVGGNLDELLHPEKLADPGQLGGGAPQPQQPGVPPQVRFNPNMRFGPQPGQTPSFRLTVATPRLSVLLEAHPREWTDPSPALLYAGAADAAQLRPFMRLQASAVAFDLGVSDGGATFMRTNARSFDVQDLRLAYRLQEFVRQSQLDAAAGSSDEEGDAGMVTPPSHLSDSGQSTPVAGHAAPELHAALLSRQAGSSGAAPGLDASAPPDVRQRVLDPAVAAELEQDGADVGSAGAAGELTPVGDQMARLYRAARKATADLHQRTGSGALAEQEGRPGHRRHPSSAALSADLSDADSFHGGFADTPATPSTGGFSFMVPGPTHRPPATTPGLVGHGSGGGSGLLGNGEHRHETHAYTGLRLSVARRLSEQAERRRSVHTPSTGGSALGTGGTSPGSAWAAGQPAGAGGTGEHAHAYGRVIDFIPEDADLAGLLGEGEEVAVVRVLSAPAGIPPSEATGSRTHAPRGSTGGVKLEVSLSMLADSTMAVEVALSDALLHWPYFKDLSLIWSITNLFGAPWSPQRPPRERDDLLPPSAAARRKREPPPPLAGGPTAWLYFNLLVAQSQIFVPVYDVDDAREMSGVLWNVAQARQKSDFEQVADMALAFAVLGEVDEKHERLALEERGLALTTTALRFAYAFGGDGESNVKVDLRDTAAFVRDPSARVNCAMLPFSLKLDVDMKVPQVAEQWEVERLHRAASAIQQAWRRHVARRAEAAAGGRPSALPQAVAVLQGAARAAVGPRRLDSMLAAVETVEHGDPQGKPWQLVDELVMDVASPHTRKLLRGYKQQSQDRSQLMYLQRYRATSSTVLHIEAGALTLRAAFSHIPFWRSAATAVQRVVLAPAGAAAGAGAGASRGAPGVPSALQRSTSTQSVEEAACLLATAVSGGAMGEAAAEADDTSGAPAAAEAPDAGAASSPSKGGGAAGAAQAQAPAPAAPFRPSSLQIHLGVEQATAVLCNDKPETFGMPDVLQCSVAGVALAFDGATLLPDRPANKAGRLSLKSYASFLNSSTSRWEPLFDSWPLTAEFVDIVSPIYLSDRQTNIWLTSEQHLDVNFNPASLLSIGDALAFMRDAQECSSLSGVAGQDLLHTSGSDTQLHRAPSLASGSGGSMGPAVVAGPPPAAAAGISRAAGSALPAAAVPAPTAAAGPAPAPSISSSSGVMSRAPQKYLIQNHSGMKVFYWTEGSKDCSPRSPVFCLEPGASENLRVVPASKRLSFVQFGSSAVGSERLGATINLHFEGNWMPVVDVAVNVVGKYRYRMTSPADSTWVPLIIDIILVGRTKIITLHSGVWVENSINRDVSLRLHVPTTSLVPPPSGSGKRAAGGYSISENDVCIGPLKPGAGCYLPLTAVLGGRLFLRPDGFQEAARDVVRLSPDIAVMLSQQGFVSCEPELLGLEEAPLHMALQAVPAKLVSEFQAFKHMECVAPGTIQRAAAPLEVTLSVQPTLVLHNALPYEMRVLLWQHLPAAGGGDALGGAPTLSLGLPPDMGSLSPRGSAAHGPSRRRTTQHGTGPAPPTSRAPHEAFLDFISPRGPGATTANRRGSLGRYFAHSIAPGSAVHLYLDMRQVVQMHVSVEEIGMRSTKWATVSHGVRHVVGPDGTGGLEPPPKLPHEVPLRMVGVGMGLPTSLEGGGTVDRYLAKLKDAALHMRMLHAQFHYDAKLAVSRADVEAAWGRLRAMAKRVSKASGGFVHNRMPFRAGGSRRRSGSSSPPPRRRRRNRFPTIIDARRRRTSVAAESAGQARRVGRASATPRPASSLDSEAAGEALAQAAGPAVVFHQVSAGHIVVEHAAHVQQAEQQLQQRATAAAEDKAGTAAAQQQPAARQESRGPAPPLALLPVREASLEGPLVASSSSAASTPKGVAVGPSTVASPSQASETHLLADVPLSATAASPGAATPAGTAAAGASPAQRSTVAGGRVAKRRAGLSRFARALDCLSLRQSKGGGGGTPPPAPSPCATRVEAAPAAGSVGGATSANASPSLDSRTSSRTLLSDRFRRSDLPAEQGGAAGSARTAAPATGSRYPVRGSTGDEGVIVGLEAVPEGSSAAEQAAEIGDGTAGQAAPPAPPAATPASTPSPAKSPLWGRRKSAPEEDAAAAAAAQAAQQGQEGEEESRERQVLRAAFEAWRMHCADAVWRRHGRGEGGAQPASPRSDTSYVSDDVQVRTPPLLHLGLHNSLSERNATLAAGSTRITLFSPYWLNNRTGVDLFYQDKLSAPGQPFLFGAALPWDYGEVFTPGTSMTEAGSREPSEAEAAFDGGINEPEAQQALLEYKLVLMNKQDEVTVGLAHVPHRRYSPAIKITTVGNKSSLELRGPVHTRPLKPRDVPLAVAHGLADAVAAAAKGTATALRHRSSQEEQAAAAAAAEAAALAPREIVSQISLQVSVEAERGGQAGHGQPGAVPGSPAVPLSPGMQPPRPSPFDADIRPAASQQQPQGALVPSAATQASPAALELAAGAAPALGRSPSGSAQGTPGSLTPTASFGAKHKHLRRASMQDNSVVETVSTQPGTMLVRVTSGAAATPTGRQLRRLGSSLGGHGPSLLSAASLSLQQAPAPEQDVDAAVRFMQEVPVPADPAAVHTPTAASEAEDEGSEEEDAVGDAEARAAAPAAAGDVTSGHTAAAEVADGAHPEDVAAIALATGPQVVQQQQQQVGEAAVVGSAAQAAAAQAVPRASLSGRRRSTASTAVERLTDGPTSSAPSGVRFTAPELDDGDAAHPPKRGKHRAGSRLRGVDSEVVRSQKAYEFAVDVTAGPPDSIFRHTKLLTLKPKYMIENQTGLPMLMKQFRTPDPEGGWWAGGAAPEEGDTVRFARCLPPGSRAAVYWDDADLPRELVVRPAPLGEEDEWHWSGSFPIRETEWYFGLRIRHKARRTRYMNIPVNVTVGPYGSIQVTLKSPSSVPPYRIENSCQDVQLYFIQLALVNRPTSKRYVDNLPPGQSMPYAWDEPTQRNLIRVQARVAGKESDSRVADYAPDHLGDQAMLLLPTHGGRAAASAQRRLYRSLSQSAAVPDDVKQKLVSLLAAEFSKKVYVTVYADGPTRVLRFSDDKNVSSLEAQNMILDLAARLKQVETQLRQVNAQFARLNGMSGAHALDLYGRSAAQQAAPSAEPPEIRRTASKRLPLRETTRALIRQAHSKLPQSMLGSPLVPGGDGAAGSLPVSRTPSATLQGLGLGPGAGLGGSMSRQATVRFDVPGAGTAAAGGAGPEGLRQRPMVTRSASATGAGPGVLHIPDEREERLLPYRRLMVRTGSESGVERPVSAPAMRSPYEAAAVLQAEGAEGVQGVSATRATSSSGGGGGVESQGHTTTTLRAVPSARDWGHITPSANQQAAGTRSLSMSKGQRESRQHSGSAPSAGATWRRRQDMLRGINSGDAVLLLGGDLSVTVVQAQGLCGSSKSTHPFARVYISEPFPTSTDESRAKQTTVVWQSTDPVWDEQLLFRDVCAASELSVELWDLGGTRSTAQLNRLTQNPSEVIKSCRFLGRAEVALADTLSMLSGVPAGTPLWLPLMRRDAGDAVSGQLQLRFVWEVTARSLLTIKLHALERVLAQRQEILAALQPVPAEVVHSWAPPGSGDDAGVQSEAAERTAQAGVMGAGVNLFGVDNELGMSGAGWAVKPSKVATEVLARHAHDHNRRHLLVTVLQAKGLTPRRGVVVALSANELPNPLVTVEVGRYPAYTTPVMKHTLQPRWDASVRHVFERVDPAEAALTVRMYDARGGFRQEQRLLGHAVIHCAHLRGENPTYVWVPLSRPRRRREKGAAGCDDEVSDMQVHLRLQWQTEAVRGQSTKVEVDLAGVSLVVMGGLQDELFNLTTDEIKTAAVRTRLEVKVAGTVHKVQLDNQMLDAVQPVVLAPAVEYRPSGAVASAGKEPPLVSFSFTRSFAGSGDRGSDGGIAAEVASQGGASEADPSIAAGGDGDKQSIKSFKDIRLDIGAMDLQTDEAFLEALLSFITSIPTADVHQDRPWRQQQRRLLAAQFGPREVESLAVNAIVPAPGEEEAGEGPLDWVVEKEFLNLEVLHGQSDLSSWYFIESAEVGALEINVTVSLSSRLLSAGRTPAQPKTNATGAFNRALGASGFSLVNVANVPIQLGKWMVGNDPANSSAAGARGLVSNGFLSQKALVNNLARHYTREGLKEAHKVLGGAGPAVASVPLTVLWAGGSAFALLRSITAGNTGPVVALQQVAYVPLMTMSMLVSGFSRMLAASLAAVPPYRANGDEATVQRLIRRPNSALEAAARAPVELFYGFTSAGFGLLMDPVAGWQEARAPGLALGTAKALVGLLARPMVGGLEASSKLLHSLALASLGREGILGKMQRRVKAPGAFAEMSAEAAEEEPRREAQVHMRQLLAAWQRVLPEFFPSMTDDVVADVINVRTTRVVLITNNHIAYLRARHQPHQSIYKAKWLVPVSEVQNLSGDSESLKIQLTHVHRYDLWLMGVWPVQKRKGLRCATRAIYERLVVKLSRLLQKGRGEGGDDKESMDPGLRRFAGANLADLAILSRPYLPPPLPSAVEGGVNAASDSAALLPAP